MIPFPGAIYDAGGNTLDEPRLRPEQADLDGYPHRSLVTDRDGAPVAREKVAANDGQIDPAHDFCDHAGDVRAALTELVALSALDAGVIG